VTEQPSAPQTSGASLEAIKLVHNAESEGDDQLARARAEIAAQLQRLTDETEAAVSAARRESEAERAQRLAESRDAVAHEVAALLEDGKKHAAAIRPKSPEELKALDGPILDTVLAVVRPTASGA
jgi:hypothetical protein